MALVSKMVRYLNHPPRPVVRTPVDVVTERIATVEAIKVIEVRTAAVFISASKTKVPRVGQTSSPTLPDENNCGGSDENSTYRQCLVSTSKAD